MKIEFNNLYIHFVLTTLNRLPCIEKKHRIRIEKYITGVTNKMSSKIYAVYANPDHLHLLVSKSPQVSENYFIGLIADASAKFINNNKLTEGIFAWQESASAFSVSKGDINKVCRYILNQETHHNKISYDDEYNSFMMYYQQKIPIRK